MTIISIVFFLTFWCFANAAAECEDGWVAYRDELCIRAFTENVLTYDEAKIFCSSQGTDSARASLVMVKNSDMQELLANHTHNNFDSLWLGSQYNNESAQFLWDDGEPLIYTNWAEGYPRNISDTDICISLRPANAKPSNIIEGNWEDAVCQRRNVALCQRTMSWTLKDAVEEIMKLRKRDLELQDELDTVRTNLQEELDTVRIDLQGKIETVRTDLVTVTSRVVPVGSIYIEYYNQPSPPALWPTLSWQDISSTYAGLFFRAQGGDSAAWGSTQGECAPRVTGADYDLTYTSGGFPTRITLPENGWSQTVQSGWNYPSAADGLTGLSFNTQGCEIRPKNQAIRVWKRTA